jgi:molecular chaperone GrpE
VPARGLSALAKRPCSGEDAPGRGKSLLDEPHEEPGLLPPPGPSRADGAEAGGELQGEIERLRRTVRELQRKVERDRETVSLWRELQPKFMEFLLDLLEVMDSFERAEQAANERSPLDAIAEGLAAVRRQMLAALERRDIRPFDPAGEPFDPESQQVLDAAGIEGEVQLRVAETLRPGYRIGDRVLRKAWVRLEVSG